MKSRNSRNNGSSRIQLKKIKNIVNTTLLISEIPELRNNGSSRIQ